LAKNLKLNIKNAQLAEALNLAKPKIKAPKKAPKQEQPAEVAPQEKVEAVAAEAEPRRSPLEGKIVRVSDEEAFVSPSTREEAPAKASSAELHRGVREPEAAAESRTGEPERARTFGPRVVSRPAEHRTGQGTSRPAAKPAEARGDSKRYVGFGTVQKPTAPVFKASASTMKYVSAQRPAETPSVEEEERPARGSSPFDDVFQQERPARPPSDRAPGPRTREPRFERSERPERGDRPDRGDRPFGARPSGPREPGAFRGPPRGEGYQPRGEGYQPRGEGYQPRGEGGPRGPGRPGFDRGPRPGGEGRGPGGPRGFGRPMTPGAPRGPGMGRPPGAGPRGPGMGPRPGGPRAAVPVIPGKELPRGFERREPPKKPDAARDKERAAGKLKDDRRFDARDRQGLRDSDDEGWRKRRAMKGRNAEPEARPESEITIRLPIVVKDLAAAMKLKVSQLISKLFMQGLTFTVNDSLDDETLVQLVGAEFGCTIHIDRSEEQRVAVTSQSIREEVAATAPEELIMRAPVVAFMGHVDHGKTSLIDAIRSSNRAAGEAGAITQHIGAFQVQTAFGPITILDTPGHEAFSAMRERGAEVTDVVVLVVAGDEGMRQQTIEALNQARAANVQIVVALNKCDRPGFNAENVYRQLADHELLPEAWGGQTICVNTSAVTKEGVQQLLEMIALQTEVMELKANPASRARGTVLESEMHKGQGATATVLVQNGTLRSGDSLVFDTCWARVKTMRNDLGQSLKEAGPSMAVKITGLSDLPDAGSEFVVVKNEREAREISEARVEGLRQAAQAIKRPSMDSLLDQAQEKKILRVIVKADVKGSLEAVLNALSRIKSEKVSLEAIASGVGEVSESDVNLAGSSKATILGFHTAIEAHAADLVRERGVVVRMHDIIYHLVDDVKELMRGLLDKVQREQELGVVEVRQTFRSSALGVIAGCQVIQGIVKRNSQIRVVRDNQVIWRGSIASLKRLKEDVREVAKGYDCGILLNGFSDFKEGDLLQAFEIEYIAQQL
jgi:translation initiation factor IF-2